MKWAFWRSESSMGRQAAAGARAGKGTGEAEAERIDERVDEASALRRQARRRLIGAAVILLATAAVVPLVLDPQPRPLPESIPIEVRGDSASFTPRVPLPVPDPAALQGAPPPDAASDAAPAGAAVRLPDAKTVESKGAVDASAVVTEPPASQGVDKSSAGADAAGAKGKGEPRPESKSEGSKPAKSAVKADARFAVQAAALRSEQAARDLMARLKSAGLPAYVERTEAADGPRWRVRAGPYATRADAERARTRLRELGQGGDLVAL